MAAKKLQKFYLPFTDLTRNKGEDEIKELLESEVQQGKLRLSVSSIFMLFAIYFTFINDSTPVQVTLWKWVWLIGFFEFINSFSVTVLIKKGYIKRPNGARIVYGQLVDTACLLTGMWLSEYLKVWVSPYFFPVFTMLILGNGLRFGLPFLITSSIFAIGAMSWVTTFPFWQESPIFSNSVMLNFVVLAVYTLALVRRLGQVQESLVTSQKSKVETLQEVGKLKSQFFANISHEFRTPIAITLATIDTLLSGRVLQVSKDLKEKLLPVKRNQRRLLALVNQLLDLEKLEQGEINLKVQQIGSPSSFLIRRLEQFDDLAEKKGLQLIKKIDEKVTTAETFADAHMLDKAVFNLLSNAIKFTEKGSVTLESVIEDKHWKIRVRDTGVGIKKEELGKVFERFQQAHGSESKDYAGTGIGLSLVKEVAESHSGEVGLTSVYGEGSCFEISIPTGKEHFSVERILDTVYRETDEGGLQSAEAEQEGKENIVGIDETVAWNENLQHDKTWATLLFVDDNADLRKFVKESLQDKYNVYLGFDGEHGYKMAQQYRPDVIISDQMMPNLTGTGLLKKIRGDNELRSTPFVILTANVNPEAKMESLKLGADDFLYKPFYIEEVIVRIDNLLKLRDQQQRIEKDLLAARSIQQSLLPKLTNKHEGFQLKTLYKPADQLSGDFFDVHENDEFVIFYLADVTSHGVASAQVTYLIKSIFINLLKDGGFSKSPSELLNDFAGEYINNDIDFGVALQICKFNKISGQLEMAHSSSPPAIVYSNNKTDFISPDSGPYIHPEIEFDSTNKAGEYKATLTAGDVFLCYTDGAIELSKDKTKELSPLRFASKIKSSVMDKDWENSLVDTLSEIKGDGVFEDDISVIRLEVLQIAKKKAS